MFFFYFAGGLLLSWIYSAATMPATVWVIQNTFGGGIKEGIKVSLALSLSQFLWSLIATLLLFTAGEIVIYIDPALRLFFGGVFIWMALLVRRAAPVLALKLKESANRGFFHTFKSSFLMPWRLVVWLGIFLAVSVHLKLPGTLLAIMASCGAFCGLVIWGTYFVLLTRLFAHRVPEAITLKSLNKLRLLAFTVYLGLALVILGPLFLLV